MRVTYCDSPTPHLLLEDVYTSNQLNIIWEEIDSLQKHLLLPDKTGSAFEFGPLKKNSGLYLYKHYASGVSSPICKSLHGIAYNPDTVDTWGNPWIKQMVKTTNWETTLLSYYNDSDYYKPHHDVAVFTTLIWLWKEPKAFVDGDFILNNYDYTVPVKNNCGIIFLSSEKHSVNPVRITDADLHDTPGRYCLTHFCGIKNLGS